MIVTSECRAAAAEHALRLVAASDREKRGGRRQFAIDQTALHDESAPEVAASAAATQSAGSSPALSTLRKMSMSRKGMLTLRKVEFSFVPNKSDSAAAALARMRAESLSPERRREIARNASAAAVKARKKIPKGKRSEIAKKAAAVRWEKKRDRGDVALEARPPGRCWETSKSL
jgi:hypothetical protein